MSMNILVETRLAPKIIFDKENPTLFAGEFAIEEDLTEIRIGDGEKKWKDLTPIQLPKEVMSKWYDIATGTTNSRLITLPDINFAYTVVNADSNAMIEQIVDTIVMDKNYFTLTETKKNLIEEDKVGLLQFAGSSIFDVLFLTNSDQEKIQGISSLGFTSTYGKESRQFFLVDEGGRALIKNLDAALKSTQIQLNELDDQINDTENGIEAKVSKYLKHFAESDAAEMGLVKKATDTQINAKNFFYFLSANGSWKEVKLVGESIPLTSSDLSSNNSIAKAIEDLRNNQTKIAISEDTTSDQLYVLGVSSGGTVGQMYYSKGVYIDAKNQILIGAAYNDYAEARKTKPIAPGRVVVENGDDTLSISTERLMLGGNIVSDTYGMLIGETDEAKTPIALCGRVLAYPNEDLGEYYAGAPVCTGPNGTVSLMSKDEVLHYPECIIGYVSAVPTYEEWNGKKVNGRIWVKVV